MSVEELWTKTVKLSYEIPYVFSSRRYALKGAAEKIAEDLSPAQAKKFMKYASEHYMRASNYAGD